MYLLLLTLYNQNHNHSNNTLLFNVLTNLRHPQKGTPLLSQVLKSASWCSCAGRKYVRVVLMWDCIAVHFVLSFTVHIRPTSPRNSRVLDKNCEFMIKNHDSQIKIVMY